MGNLGQLTTLVSTELGLFDDTSIALIKTYLGTNYSNIWDKYPWRDTQVTALATMTIGDAGVAYPAGMDRVITIRATTVWMSDESPESPEAVDFRSDSRFLDPITSTYLVETDPDMFERLGPVKYYEEYTDHTTGTKYIRIFPRASKETRLLFIGKAVCPVMVEDTDTTILRNIQPALVAYATADMLKRQRQYGKADLRRKEAMELEAAAWNLEQQQANLPRRTKTTTVSGNSLAEMMDAVCQICGQWTPDYQLVIREFLRRNYQALYDVYLWPESLVMVRVPYATEQVVMPAYIDKVLGVRGTNDLRMFPADAGLFLDIAPSMFDEVGDPVGFTTLTPVAVSTLPATTTRLVLASTSVGDTGPVAIRGEVLSTGVELEEVVFLNGTTPQYTNYSYDIPLTIAKDVTIGDVTVNAASDMTSLEVIPRNVRELKHQRLWFLPAPDSGRIPEEGFFTCLVLGKRAIRPLVNDQDTPIITGAQQILIAAAAGDLFRKLEKNDMANAMLQKASASTDVLKAKNLDQAASAPRFVPQIEPRAYVGDYGCCTW